MKSNFWKRNFLATTLFIAFTVFSSCQENPKADRIYINAHIWTGDSSNPSAGAIGVKDSAIAFVENTRKVPCICLNTN